jgi:hypothetical protein
VARRRSPSGVERPPQGAQALAAKHRLTELVNHEPELWPLLNELTLSERLDWPAIERLVRARRRQLQRRLAAE